MENQNRQSTPVDSGPRPVDSLNPISLETDLSNAPVVDAHVAARNYYQTRQTTRKRWPTVALVAAVVMLLAGALALRISRGNDQGSLASQTNVGAGFNTVSIPLDAFNTKGLDSFETAQIVNVNGQLKVNGSLVLAPINRPTDAVAGQLFYDKTTNQVNYFNGSSFIQILDSQAEVLKSVGGLTGAVGVGAGISTTNGQLTNSGVLSLQGQTGNVSFTAGSGILLNGTTLINNGITALGGQNGSISLGAGLILEGRTLRAAGTQSVTGSGDIVVSNDGNGNVTISYTGTSGTTLPNLPVNSVVIGQGTDPLSSVSASAAGMCLISTSGAPVFAACPGASATGNVTTAGGTPGRIAKFSGTVELDDSLLSETGSTVNIAGDINLSTGFGFYIDGQRLASGNLADSSNLCLVSTNNCGVTPGAFIQNGTVQQSSANFNIDGTGMAGTLNAAAALQLGGININTAGTLSNVAYLNQNNAFTGNLTIGGSVRFSNLGAGLVFSDGSGVLSSNVVDRNNPVLLSGALDVANGGTGLNMITANGLVYGNGTATVGVTAAGTAGQIVVASSSRVPTFVTVSGDIAISSSGVTALGTGVVTNAKLANSSVTVSAGTNLTGGGVVSLGNAITLNVASSPSFSGSVDSLGGYQLNGATIISSAGILQNVTTNANIITSGTLPIARGGTGQSLAPTNGQLLIGNGSGYTLAGLTQGSGIAITNAAGSITVSVDNTVCTTSGNCSGGPSAGSGFYIQNGTTQQTSANFNIDGTGIADTINAISALQLNGVSINTPGTLSNVAYLNQANAFSGNLSVTGSANLTIGSGTVTFGSLGAGLVQADASGVLSSSVLSRNSALLTGTLSIANGGTGVSITPTNGQLLIGNSSGYTLANLTGAGGVTITNAAGAITVGLNNTICSASNPCESPPAGGSTNYIQNGTVQQAGANFNISGGGTADTFNALTAFYINGNSLNTAGTLSNVAYLNQANNFSGNLSVTGTNNFSVGTGTITFAGLSTGIVQSSSTGVISSAIISRNDATLLSGILSTANGGTGRSSFTANGLLYGNAGGAISVTGSGTAGQLLIADASGVPTFVSASGDIVISAAGVATIQAGSVTNAKLANSSLTVSAGTNLTGGGVVALGGSVTLNVTNAPTFSGNVDAASFSRGGTTVITSSSVLQNVTANANIITAGTLAVARGGTGVTALPTNGQLLIGNGTGYTLAGLTAGDGVVITNAAGSITVSVDNTVCTSANNCPNPAPGSNYYIQNSAAQQTGATFNIDGTGTANIYNAVTAYRLGGLDINSAGTLSNVAYLNQANTFSGNLTISGTNALTVGTGTVTFGSLGAGLVQANASGALTSGSVSRNSSALFTDTLSIANGGTGVSTTPTNGQLLIGNGTGYTLATLVGTGGVTITNAAGAITVGLNNTVCTTDNTCTSPPEGGSNYYIQNGTVQQAGANFNISGGGTANNLNAITALQLNGTDINTAGTLSNVAYLNQANSFSGNLTISGTNDFTVSGGTVRFGALGTGIVQTNASGVLSSGTVDRNSSTYLTGTLTTANGGTGRTSATANGLLYGAGTGALNVTAAGTSGQLLLANASGVPTFTTVSGDVAISASGATTIQNGVVTNAKLANSSLTVTAGTNLTGGGVVALGGTVTLNVASAPTFAGNVDAASFSRSGTTVITSSSVLQNVTANANIITAGILPIARGGTGLGTTPTNGQLLIGNGSGYTLAGLTAGTGVVITNAAGAITVSVDNSVCTTANNCPNPAPGSSYYIQNGTGQQTAANFNVDGTGTASIFNAVTSYRLGGLDINTAGTLSNVAYLNQANAFSGNLSVTGTNTLTVGTGAVTFGSLGAGLVQANASGVLSSGAVNRNSSALFSGTLSIANGGTGVTATPANGQLLIGNGTGYTVAALSAGDGISITNAAGAITVAVNSSVCSSTNPCTSPPAGGSTNYIQNGTVQQASADFNISGGGTANTFNALAAIQLNGSNINTAGTLSNVAYLNQANTFSGNLTVATGNNLIVTNGSVTFGGLGAGIVQANASGVLSSGAVDRNSATLFSNTLNVANGGTGRTSATANGLLYGSGTGALGVTAAGTSGQLLVANASGVPTFVSLSGDVAISATGVTTIQDGTVTNAKLANSSVTINSSSNLVGGGSVALGGTLNLSVSSSPSFSGTINSVGGYQLNGTSVISSTGALANVTANASIITGGTFGIARGGTGLATTPTNGQLLIGNGTGYALAGLTQGGGITITNGAGAITVAVDSTICTTSNNCNYASGGGTSGSYIQNTTTQQAGANFNISGAGVIGTTLSVGGAATLSSTLNVSGASTLTSLGVTNNASVGGTFGATGAATFGNTLSVTGASTLAGLSATSGSFSSGLTVTSGGLNVTGTTRLDAPVGIGIAATSGTAIRVQAPSTTGNAAQFVSRAGNTSPLVQLINQNSDQLASFSATGALTLGNSSASFQQAGTLRIQDGVANGFYSQITSAGLTANRAITLPDANGTVCLDSNNCGYLTTAAASTSYIQNTATQQAGSNFNISGNGTIGGVLQVTGDANFSRITASGSSTMGYLEVGGVGVGTIGNAQRQIIFYGGANNHSFEIGRQDGVASSPYFDFHSGATAVDFDARILTSGGTGSNGGATLNLTAANVNLSNSANFQMGGNTVITNARVLQNVTADAGILTTGTLAVGRLSGNYTGITGVGTLSKLAVTTDFGSSVNLSLQASSATTIAQVTRAAASQTAQLLLLQDSGGVNLSGFGAAGQLLFYSGTFRSDTSSATLTANRTYTLPDSSGTICLSSNNCGFGTASGSFINNSTTLQTAAHLNIQGTSGNVVAAIRGASGTTTDVFQVYGNAGNKSVYVSGPGSLYADYGVSVAGFGNPTPTSGQKYAMGIATGDTTNVGLAIKAFNASQTADLFQIQNASSTVLARFTASGALSVTNATTLGALTVGGLSTFNQTVTINSTGGGNTNGLVLQGTNAYDTVYTTQINGESGYRFIQDADGRLNWGPGDNTTDVYIARDGAGSLLLNGNLTVSGNFFVRGANQHYGLSAADRSTAGWFRLGTLNLPQQGNNATIKLYGGSNYNANDYEEGHTEIFIRTSNGAANGPSGFGATAKIMRYGSDLFASQVKLVSNAAGSSASTYDVYVYTGPYVGNGYYTVDTGPTGSWLNNVATATDPGANSSTVLAATPYGGDSIGGTFQFSANTAAAANTTLPMNWNQEVVKRGVTHSNSTNPANITIVTPGYYAISGSVIGNCASSPCYRDYYIQVNGTNVSSATSQPNPDTNNPAFLRSSISTFYYYLNAGDIVRMTTFGNVSTTITGGFSSFMSIFYVGKDALIQSGSGGGGGGSFILNGSTQQASANFNIDGSGTIGTSLNVGGAASVGALTVVNNGLVAGNFNVAGVYQSGGTSGVTTNCSAGQVLQGITVKGGIITGGNCVSGNNIGGTFYLTSNYTLSSPADTPINWSGETNVSGLTHSTSSSPQNITIQTAGYYSLAGTVEGNGATNGTYHDVMIKVNGSSVARGNGYIDTANTGGYWKAIVAPYYRYLNVGDVITMNVGSGTGSTGLSSGDRTYLSIVYISQNFAGGGSGGSYVNNGTAVQTANFNVQSASASSITAVVRAAASQTADILQVQASDGTAYTNIDAGGRLKVTPASTTISNYSTEITAAQGHALRLITNNATSGVRLTLQDNSISDSYSRWNLDNFQGYFRFFHENAAGDSGQTNLVINKSGNICIGTNMIRANGDFDCSSNLGVAGSASVKVLSGQTADAFQVQNSSGTVLTDIAADGSLNVGVAATVSLSTAFTKLANPATLPAGNGNALAYSPDSQYLTVAHPNTPFITIYKRSGTTFTKLANPATLPTGQAYSVAWSPDGQYMSVFMNASPYIMIYKRSGDTFTKMADPATLPTAPVTGGSWSPDGQYLSLTTVVSPYVIIYKQSGDTFTKLSNPASLPAGVAYITSWSPDGKYMSVAHDTSPFITIYKRSGDVFSKLNNPATLPASTAYSGAWSPDGQFMSVAHIGAPYMTVYKQSGDTFTKIANPATLPTGDAYSSNWSPDGNFLSVAHANSPYVSVYRRIGDTLVKQGNPGTLPAGVGNFVAWSPDGQLMSVAHVGSPFVTNYVASVISGVSNTPITANLTVAGRACIGSDSCNDTLGVNGSVGVQGFLTAANVNVMNFLQTGGVVRLDSLGNLENINSINNTLKVYQSQSASQFATEVSGQYGLRISGSSPRITLQDTTITSDVSRWNIDNLAGTFRLFRENQDSANGVVALTVAANNNVSLYTSGKAMDVVAGLSNDIYQTWRSSNNGTTANNVSTIIGNLNSVGFVGTESNSAFMIRANNTYQASFSSDGTFRARGAIVANTTPDIAEHIPAAPDVEAADVVMADPANTERVVKAIGTYNSAAIGVISDGSSSFMINPYGGLNGESRTDTKPLVLAGRVPVKVTNENGAIKPGDHLTTSSTTGYAMKATRAGATIGTALGFFDGTTGTVLVLVNPSYYDPYDGNNLQANTATISTLNATNATISNLTVGNLVVTGTIKAANVGARYFEAAPAEIAHGTATTTLASLDIPDPGFAYVLQINSNLETTMPAGSRYDLTAMVNGQMVAYDRGDISPNWQRLNGTSPVMRGSSSVRLDMKRMYGDSFSTSATNRSFTVLLVPIKE